MSNAFLPDENNQPIHLKWRKEVVLNYDKLREESNHIEAYKARHRYTNYDQLVDEIKSQRLDALEQSRIVAIIKYECTSQALQFRNGVIRDQYLEAKKQSAKLAADVVRHKGLIGAIQKILWGNEKEISSLKAKLTERELELTSLKDRIGKESVESDYKKEISIWKKKFEKEEIRRIELGKKNKSLGGRVSHARRNKEKLDFVSDMLDQTENSIAQLSKDLEIAKRQLTEHKVLKRKYEQKISALEQEVRNLKIKPNQYD